MSASRYTSLLTQWHKANDSIEQGKVNAANQQRFNRIGKLEAQMDAIKLPAEEKKKLGAQVHKQLYPKATK
jgi:hypothetical protein